MIRGTIPISDARTRDLSAHPVCAPSGRFKPCEVDEGVRAGSADEEKHGYGPPPST
ncbi:MAG TPA: hypothetical protein VFS89_06575 [Nitrosospira sp.]|nr:hypothetical protein [Nitrosospira sp.]